MDKDKLGTVWGFAKAEMTKVLAAVDRAQAKSQQAGKAARGKEPTVTATLAAVIAVKEAQWELGKAAAAAAEALLEFRQVLSALGAAGTPLTTEAKIYNLPEFTGRLVEEISRSKRYRRELAVIVFQASPSLTREQGWEVAGTIAAGGRRTDITAWLSTSTFAMALPETGAAAAMVADRVAVQLEPTVGGIIPAGVAYYPTDSQEASELLRIATERCQWQPHARTQQGLPAQQ